MKCSLSEKETFQLAYDIGLKITPPLLIGISGELGAGKTIFAKGLAQALSVKELVTSPTFLGISEYYSGKYPFIHMDFYKKVVSKNLINQFLEKPSLVFIEWVENYKEVYDQELELNISVEIKYGISNNERNIEINCITTSCLNL